MKKSQIPNSKFQVSRHKHEGLFLGIWDLRLYTWDFFSCKFKHHQYTISLLVLLLSPYLMRAQATLEVATKAIEKKLPYNSNGTIIIGGENATIKIDSWEKDEVKIKLKLITKHRIKAVTIEELENIKYVLEKKGSDIYLRNYFLEQTGSSTGCILKVEYELTVPAKSNFSIKNNLGNVEIKNTEGKLDVEVKFGSINLSGIKGTIGINLSLGDIQASQMNGTATIKASHSDINMENLSGKYNLTLVNSDLIFKPINHIEMLNVASKNGDVNLFFPANDAYNLAFNISYGEIRVPDLFKPLVMNGKNKSSLKYFINNSASPITINSDFGNITLTANLISK